MAKSIVNRKKVTSAELSVLSALTGKELSSISDFYSIPTSQRTDFFQLPDDLDVYTFLMQSREDENGNSVTVPFTKADYQRLVEYEAYKFECMGVKSSDVVVLLDSTQNHALPMSNALMKLGAMVEILEGADNRVFRDLCARTHISVLVATRGVVKRLLAFLDASQHTLQLRYVITAGYPFPDFDVVGAELKKKVGATLIDTIGSRELSAYAFKSYPEEKYQFFSDHQIVEILDDDGEQTTTGNLVITPLWRKDLPLVRYSTGDAIEYDQGFTTIYSKANTVKYGVSLLPLDSVHRLFRFHYFHNNFLKKVASQFYPAESLTLYTEIATEDAMIFFVRKNIFYKLLRSRSDVLEKFGKESFSHPYIIELDDEEFVAAKTVFPNSVLDIRHMPKTLMPQFMLDKITQVIEREGI